MAPPYAENQELAVILAVLRFKEEIVTCMIGTATLPVPCPAMLPDCAHGKPPARPS